MNTAELNELAGWIAEFLTDGWKLGETDSTFQAIIVKPLPDLDRKLTIYLHEGKTKRLEIGVGHADLYRFWLSEDSIESITVSIDKFPVQIAKDIQRRLLPNYEAAMRRAFKRKQNHEAEIEARWQAVREIQALMPGARITKYDKHNPADYPETWYWEQVPGKCNFKIDHRGNFDLNLGSIPPDLAKWIARLVYLKIVLPGAQKGASEDVD